MGEAWWREGKEEEEEKLEAVAVEAVGRRRSAGPDTVVGRDSGSGSDVLDCLTPICESIDPRKKSAPFLVPASSVVWRRTTIGHGVRKP